MAAVAAVACT